MQLRGCQTVYNAYPTLGIKRVMTLACRSRKFKYAKMFVGKSEKLLKQKAINRKKTEFIVWNGTKRQLKFSEMGTALRQLFR